MNDTHKALFTLFVEVLEAYRQSEEMVIDERGEVGDYDDLTAEIEKYKTEFLGLLEDDELQQKADAAFEDYISSNEGD